MGELEKVGQLGCVRSRGKLVSFFSFFFFRSVSDVQLAMTAAEEVMMGRCDCLLSKSGLVC